MKQFYTNKKMSYIFFINKTIDYIKLTEKRILYNIVYNYFLIIIINCGYFCIVGNFLKYNFKTIKNITYDKNGYNFLEEKIICKKCFKVRNIKDCVNCNKMNNNNFLYSFFQNKLLLKEYKYVRKSIIIALSKNPFSFIKYIFSFFIPFILFNETIFSIILDLIVFLNIYIKEKKETFNYKDLLIYILVIYTLISFVLYKIAIFVLDRVFFYLLSESVKKQEFRDSIFTNSLNLKTLYLQFNKISSIDKNNLICRKYNILKNYRNNILLFISFLNINLLNILNYNNNKNLMKNVFNYLIFGVLIFYITYPTIDISYYPEKIDYNKILQNNKGFNFEEFAINLEKKYFDVFESEKTYYIIKIKYIKKYVITIILLFYFWALSKNTENILKDFRKIYV